MSNETIEQRLTQVIELLQAMICSAKVRTDPNEIVVKYEIETGALHKIVGLLSLSLPVNLPSLGWKSAVREPPEPEYATYLVVTRHGDPHTRGMEVGDYQKCYDRPIDHCTYARQWGYANGTCLNVEFYHELPEFKP